jgi:hypothetical protein
MRSNRIRKLLAWATAVLVLFTVVGFFVAPPVLKSVLVRKLSEGLGREVTVQKVLVNPYSLTVGVTGVTIRERAGKDIFFRLAELTVGIDPTSLARRALILRKIKIKDPYVHIVLQKNGVYNFSDLLESKAPATPGSKDKEPFRFSFSNIQLQNGSADFVDNPKETAHTVRQLTIEVPFISNVRNYNDIFVQPHFSANINGSTYMVKGKTKPFRESRESYVDIKITQLDIARYVRYLPIKTNCNLASALLDLNGKLSFLLGKEPTLVASGTATFSDLILDDLRKKPILKLPSATFVIDALDPFKQNIHVSSIVLKSPEITVRRLENGSIDLASLLSDDKDKTDRSRHGPTRQSKVEQPKGSKPFAFTLDEFLLEGGAATFEDHTFAPMVSIPLKEIAAKANHISTDNKTPGSVSLSLQVFKKGTISATGTVGIDPLSCELLVNTKSVYISPLQPYFQDKAKIAITRGSLSGSGKIVVKSDINGKMKFGYSGDVFLSNLSSIDRMQGDPFLEWKSLAFTRIDARFDPLYVRIGGVALTDFYSRIVVESDGSTNVQKVMGGEEGEASQPPPSSPQPKAAPAATMKKPDSPDIAVTSITLQGGRIDFADKRIKPSYEAELSELGGRVSNISLRKGGKAQLEVLGKIEKYIPLKITGTIDPSPKTLFVDLTASFKDLDVSPMTPYSSKYAGYTIAKGKLSLDVKYMIDNRKLESQNLIFLDQFTFGDPVESPDATGLPVRLAVALLKDRNGQIKLDIPVSGSIDDPQFKVGRIILQVIVNLITKAATAPFSLVASLFGGGEELGYVEFDNGSSQLDGPGMKKIETLGKVLYERPALKLEVEGRVDPERDKEALRRHIFMKKIKAQKLADMLKQRVRPVPIDEIKIETNEYDKYLTKAYGAEKFPKPRNIVGLTKSIPSSEMEKLMLTNIIVKDEDLRNLAMERARNVTDALLKTREIPTERIFVTEPKSLASDEVKPNVKNSRVDFRLK